MIEVFYPICYRDLKPENVMLLEDGETIKLIDFNTAKIVDPKGDTTVIGNFDAMPFEIRQRI